MEATYESEKYLTSIDNLRSTLDTYGVAILPSVLTEAECENLENGVWGAFEHISAGWDRPISRARKDSWKGLGNLYHLHNMLWQSFGLGHAQAVWEVRQNPRVIAPFEKLWDCEASELLASFDGVGFAPPPETTGRGWFDGKTWYHTDQSYTRVNFECVQSWVTACDVDEGDATLCVLEGSHKLFAEAGHHFKATSTSDWYKLNDVEEAWYVEKGCTRKRIKCTKGSMVFWDSRTIHCGGEPIRLRASPHTRCVAYVCYAPRSNCGPASLEKRKTAFEDMRMTSHWPTNVKLFSKTPRTYGKAKPDVRELPRPTLSDLGRSLVGY
ncbi:hypothetical protein M427DRAFT_51303 [Gonapodya prolifera JEL478]|uniref:Phytanoyl-CoA dioxygenase n=1 Tax=Gonapodya prolifera (strain JEL478) TaxID=1344416 RepID=A0A139AZ01_GONPJ|nr:hypothetical protein M427DRAFT_51303 [Gonapodya prolifera JEL478]|eukprot:KXS21930.1 hypothetical protein M427DRAFT_51303 [Gonapodya prolifera JEL478]